MKKNYNLKKECLEKELSKVQQTFNLFVKLKFYITTLDEEFNFVLILVDANQEISPKVKFRAKLISARRTSKTSTQVYMN